MKTMYPAQVNSPGTELAAAIDAAQDTIQVADGSVLPDGPNLLTIGTDEAAETILYTDKTGDELTGITRGFQGTAQSWAAGTKVARYFTAYDHDAAIGNISELSTGLTAAKDRLDTEERQDVVLNAGMQILNAQHRATFSLSGIKGRMLVNLLGRDGAFEYVNPWTAYSVKGAPTVVNNEITVIGSGVNTNPQISRNLKAAPVPKVGDRMFIRAIGKTKNACESLRAYLYISAPISTRHGEIIVSSPTVDKPYALYKSFTVTQQLVDNWETTGFILAAQHTSAAAAKDTVAVYSQAALYVVATQDLGLTDDELAAKYTYVDSVQPVRNPYAIRYGENLLPPFYEWVNNTGGQGFVKEPYFVEIQGAASVGRWFEFYAPIVPGQTYTLSSTTSDPLKFYGLLCDENMSILAEDRIIGTFIVPTNAAYLRVFANTDSGTSLYSFKNPMLSIGSYSNSFRSREDSMLALQTDLYADPVTDTNADEVFEKDGQYFKLAKWKKVALDGNLSWGMFWSFTGYKQVMFPISTVAILNVGYATKFNGSILTLVLEGQGMTAGDQFAVTPREPHFTISNADSGWGDNYTPTADEIKAYFMGWKMGYLNGSTFTSPYNGTGTKVWRAIVGDTTGTGAATLPTDISSVSLSNGWKPYQLVYQLATPTIEPIVSEGMLTFNEGDNQIEVGTGIVVRESVKPRLGGDGSKWYIGETVGVGSRVKYAPDKFLGVYRDNKDDKGVWKSQRTGSTLQGAEFLYIESYLYDPAAAYSVTYLRLDKSPIVPVSGSYAANEKAMLQELTDSVQQNATAVSVLMNKKVDKDAPAVQITPTLLNGWVEYQDGYHPVRYYKDSSGVVHLTGLVKSGAVSSILFKLASGFRPNSSLMFAAHASINSTVRIDVYKNGEIFFNYVGQWDANAWVSLDGIMFLAEQ